MVRHHVSSSRWAVSLLVTLAVGAAFSVHALSAQSLVKDLRPGTSPTSPGSEPSSLWSTGPYALMTADDGLHGRDLWRCDGTAAGTSRVADLPPRTAILAHAVDASGTSYFLAVDDAAWSAGTMLWKSDGTSIGTAVLMHFAPASYSGVSIVTVGSTAYFGANDGLAGPELWRTDGTAAGTTMVRDLVPGPEGADPRALFAVGGDVYFGASSLVGATLQLWKSDGSIGSGTFISAIQPQQIVPVEGGAFVVTGVEGARGNRLYRTDGTGQGTTEVTLEGLAGHYEIGAMAAVGGRLFFSAGETMSFAELWVVPKGKSVAHLVADINQQP